MAEIIVRTVTTYRVKLEDYLAAAQEDVDHSHDQEDVDRITNSMQALAEFVGEPDPESLVPRWAYDSVTVVSQESTFEQV